MSSSDLSATAAQNGIYAGLVSQTLDLLELLYTSGGNPELLSFEKWIFNANDSNFFGRDHAGHKLLTSSFRQAASQTPFNGEMEITLIYYKEGGKEVLVGGTSPFTMVFTSPNLLRKIREKRLKNIDGLTSNRALFTGPPMPLHQRDPAFIWYMENLVSQPIRLSAEPFINYVLNTRRKFEHQEPERFRSQGVELQDILFEGDIPLLAAGKAIQQISAKDYQNKIQLYSDFLLDLPVTTAYPPDSLRPLFLISNMDLDGQYTSPSNYWSNRTVISALAYGQSTAEGLLTRTLPGLKNVKYPFISKFDIFEKSLIRLPGYLLNENKFLTLIDKQDFLLPIKPLFFQFFPLDKITDYVTISRVPNSQGTTPEIVVEVRIPIKGPTMGKRQVIVKQTYKLEPLSSRKDDEGKYPMTEYQGILGIFPFLKTEDPVLRFINNYTIASYEKTNHQDQLNGIRFLKKNGQPISGAPAYIPRSDYQDLNTRTGYYHVKESFDIIQLNFHLESNALGGLIVPKFKQVINGTDEYVYGIDFGTSNTHIEYSRVENKQAVAIKPFEINEAEQGNMVSAMLNRPSRLQELDGAISYDDYTWFGVDVDAAKVIALREFVPFQIGGQRGANTKFPFRTATFENKNFKANQAPQLFSDANIGFNIDRDILVYNQGYQTDIKWQLETDLTNPLKENRVRIFFRQLLLMIRSHALLIREPEPLCDMNQLKIAMSYPTSMDNDLKKVLMRIFSEEMSAVFNLDRQANTQAVLPGDQAHRLVEVTESIAPYYQLLKADRNIQHNIYCNVDIGGGTSDIVLVNNVTKGGERVLNCYCNSVKFAGKQLWGSVSDSFDPLDNGFLLFFLEFLESRNVKDYEKIKELIHARKNRTEDIISYLFTEESLGFKQIFTECKALKVPLLLHYTALLHFIASCCKEKEIELPKTLSFSGKGSEFIQIIFASDEHLLGYTKKALMLFSGLIADRDFKIKKSTDPKAITAQGSVIYGANPLRKQVEDIFDVNASRQASDEIEINAVAETYLGLTGDLNPSKERIYADFQEPGQEYQSVMTGCKEFLKSFFDSDDLIRGSEKSLNIVDIRSYRSFFLDDKNSNSEIYGGVLRNSYKSAIDQKPMRNKVTDSPFFFPFNTSLIELSKKIANEAIAAKNI
ncbi:hypothetical protein INP83_10840 [Mucilaginibacter sp. 21P]|uniref:hypothetical protein n=1 Tax=Mucilaginibacter sp. 21P TaxID=2778902 RepID=UPI001C582647|nr:hypothetical protein [Mucilaginibacter sp. 21P]QXV63614.1 hypothetical protein INP83_10840 [Mucilaginibacter sp. 21P]